jgi:hypothetical protein
MPLASLFVSVIVLVVGYFVFRVFLEHRNRQFDQEKLRGYRERIRQDPNNIGAYEQLGNVAFATKHYAEAMQAYQMAVNLGYHSRVVSEQSCYRLRLLQQWQAENGNPRLKPTLPVLCQSCGAINHRSRQYCVECNAPLPADTFLGALQHGDARRACIEGGIAMALVIFLTLVCAPLDPISKFVLIMFAGGLAFWWIQHTVDGSRA